jgi:excisionase family DNA binding protein
VAFGDDYVTVAEAAKRTGYSTSHIAHLLESKRVTGLKPGRDWFVHLPSLIAYQQTARVGRPPKRRRSTRKEI